MCRCLLMRKEERRPSLSCGRIEVRGYWMGVVWSQRCGRRKGQPSHPKGKNTANIREVAARATASCPSSNQHAAHRDCRASGKRSGLSNVGSGNQPLSCREMLSVCHCTSNCRLMKNNAIAGTSRHNGKVLVKFAWKPFACVSHTNPAIASGS